MDYKHFAGNMFQLLYPFEIKLISAYAQS